MKQHRHSLTAQMCYLPRTHTCCSSATPHFTPMSDLFSVVWTSVIKQTAVNFYVQTRGLVSPAVSTSGHNKIDHKFVFLLLLLPSFISLKLPIDKNMKFCTMICPNMEPLLLVGGDTRDNADFTQFLRCFCTPAAFIWARWFHSYSNLCDFNKRLHVLCSDYVLAGCLWYWRSSAPLQTFTSSLTQKKASAGTSLASDNDLISAREAGVGSQERNSIKLG